MFVTDGDLALGIGAELGGFALALLAGFGEKTQDPVRIVDRRRHQIRRFLAGITEHDALVASAFVTLLVGGVIDALRDVGRLRVKENVDLGGLPVEAVLFVTDVADGAAGGGLELRRVDDVVTVLVLLHQRRRQTNFTGNDDAIGGRQGLAGDADGPGIDAGSGSFTVNKVDDLVGDTVTNLVRMTFCNGLTGEQVTSAHYGIPLKEMTATV